MAPDRRVGGQKSRKLVSVTITHWTNHDPATAEELDALLRNDGLSPRWWSNGAGDTYAPHSHSYHKVLYCSRGSITFVVDGKPLTLAPGDRLDIPQNTAHSAIVGPEGVECVEAGRR
jgi:mannose-6-phosphate isomerase-like protein (cupin superfamily)